MAPPPSRARSSSAASEREPGCVVQRGRRRRAGAQRAVGVELVVAERATSLVAAAAADDLDPGRARARFVTCAANRQRRAPLAVVEDVDGVALGEPRPRASPLQARRGRVGARTCSPASATDPVYRSETHRRHTVRVRSDVVLAALPSSISPSRISTFTDCPRMFQYQAIERLEQPPTVWTLKGTLVHSALEGLFGAAARDAHVDLALRALDEAAAATRRSRWRWPCSGSTTRRATAFVDDAADAGPALLRARGPDARSTPWASSCASRRSSRPAAGSTPCPCAGSSTDSIVTSTATSSSSTTRPGRAPGPGRERSKLAGVETYALLCERVLGVRPVAVRLLYLRAPDRRRARGRPPPTVDAPGASGRRGVAGDLEGTCRRERSGPLPGPLCRYCAFTDRCEGAASIGLGALATASTQSAASHES